MKTAADYEWILTERVTGTVHEYGIWIHSEKETPTTNPPVLLSVVTAGTPARTKLLFDGKFVNVGDDLMSYLSVMDEIQEQGWSEPYDENDPSL